MGAIISTKSKKPPVLNYEDAEGTGVVMQVILYFVLVFLTNTDA